MPTPEEIANEKQQLYESASLRDDLNDAEATVLLKWGETQVERMAQMFPNDFEQKTRFLRQLLKNINRFVGQREFNDLEGQRKYMESVVKFLEPLGYKATEEELFAALPTDAKDMKANLDAILNLLTPQVTSGASDTPPPATPEDLSAQNASPPLDSNLPETTANTTVSAATKPSQPEDLAQGDTSTFHPNTDKTEVIPDIRDYYTSEDTERMPSFRPNIDKTEVIPDISHTVRDTNETKAADDNLEKRDTDSINQPEDNRPTGEIASNDEKTE